MATLKEILREKKHGVRPNNNAVYCNHIWLVEKDEEYDLVQFSIEELGEPYWWKDFLCVPCDLTDEQVETIVKEYVEKYIDEKEIKDFRWFLEMGNKYGWD